MDTRSRGQDSLGADMCRAVRGVSWWTPTARDGSPPGPVRSLRGAVVANGGRQMRCSTCDWRRHGLRAVSARDLCSASACVARTRSFRHTGQTALPRASTSPGNIHAETTDATFVIQLGDQCQLSIAEGSRFALARQAGSKQATHRRSLATLLQKRRVTAVGRGLIVRSFSIALAMWIRSGTMPAPVTPGPCDGVEPGPARPRGTTSRQMQRKAEASPIFSYQSVAKVGCTHGL